MKPNKEGVWSIGQGQPPIVVLTIYGEWKWRQVGCDNWADLDDLDTTKPWQPLWVADEHLQENNDARATEEDASRVDRWH